MGPTSFSCLSRRGLGPLLSSWPLGKDGWEEEQREGRPGLFVMKAGAQFPFILPISTGGLLGAAPARTLRESRAFAGSCVELLWEQEDAPVALTCLPGAL